MTTKREAIESLVPNARFKMKGATITWNAANSDPQPSDSAITVEQTRLNNLFTAEKYKRDRAAAYPNIADQLDMQYWDKKNGTTTWVDAVAKVKSDNPKP